jgi:hypothetical protein
MKKKTFSACVMAALLTAGIASTQVTAGVLAEGNISVYKGGQLTNTITGQQPVDEEALMVCNEKCMVKSTGVSIIGVTGSELAVKNDQEQFNLLLKKGKLDFLLSGAVKKMGFYTADRQYAHAEAIFNANTDTPVRGYMEVTPEGSTRVGVYEGRLVFNTLDGAKTVDSNNYILLAQANMDGTNISSGMSGAENNEDWTCNDSNIGRICDKNTADWECSDENLGKECDYDVAGFWPTEAIIGGTVVAAAAAYGLYEYLDDDDDDDSTSSSSTTSSTSSTSSSSKSSSGSSSRSTRNPSPNI